MSEFTCKYCNTSLASITSYRNHCNKKHHKINIQLLQNKQKEQTLPNDKNQNHAPQSTYQFTETEFNCIFCNKSYYNKGNLTRHHKTCIKLQEEFEKNKTKLYANFIECNKTIISNKHAAVKNNITKVEHQPANITINIQNITNINGDQNITNNTNIANTANMVNIELTPEEIYNNFWQQANIRPMGFEDLTGLDSQEIADKIHGLGLNCFVEFINQIYKNDVNHNIALYNKREKMVKYVHKSGEIKIDTLVSVMSSVMMNFVDYLDTYLEKQDIEIKPQYLPIIKKLKEIHASEENTLLYKYKRHLYSRLLNITNSSLKKMEQYDNKLKNELNDSVKELGLYIPSTNCRTEPDLTTC